MHDANPKIKVSDVPKAKSLIQMVEDDSILNVFAMQSRIEGYQFSSSYIEKPDCVCSPVFCVIRFSSEPFTK